PPEDWPKNYGDLIVNYFIQITKLTNNNIKITQEELTVKSLFLLTDFLNGNNPENTENFKELTGEKFDQFRKSELKFFRKKNGKFSFESNFDFNDENSMMILKWLGLDRLMNNKIDNKKVRVLLDSILNNYRKQSTSTNQITFLSQERHVINFS